MTQPLTIFRPFSGLRARIEPLAPALPDGLTRAIVWTWLIAGGFGVVLKIQRIAAYPQSLSLDKQLALIVPELAFGAAALSGSLLLAIGATRLRRPAWALVTAQLTAAMTAVVQTLSHGYFRASGQPLDYAMFAFSLARASERVGVVASESDGELASAVIGVLFVIAFVPAFVWGRSRARRLQLPATFAHRRRWAALWLAASSAACFALTGFAPLRRVEKSFARDPVTTLAVGFMRSQLPDPRYHGKPSRLRKTGAKSLTARPGAKRRNIAIIILESTRADATTPYTPSLKTTPFLEQFARESVLVERAYAVVPHTTKALVAILCGFEPEVTLSTIEAQPGGLPGRCLPSLLGEAGYATAFFQAPTGRFEDRKMLAENLGFATFVSGDESPKDGLERINYFGYEDAIVLEPSERWLAERRGQSFMAAYLTSASHHPYGVPSTHETKRFTRKREKNKYLNALNYSDGVVARIVEQYRRLGLLDDTVIVVVGDHGEAFGEHGLYVHDDVMFEEALRVPLLFRLPGAERAGQRIPGPIGEIAIVPSLITLAGFEPRDSEYEQGNLFEFPRQPALYANCYRSDRCAAVIRDPYKLIHHFDERPAELYDLVRDPDEKTDLADEHPERVERWGRELADVRLAIHATYRDAAARALTRYVSTTEPEIRQRLAADFGDYLSLRGLKAPGVATLRNLGNKSGPIRFLMRYYWYVHKRIPPGYSLRVNMRGEGGASVTAQHHPLRGLMPVQDFPPQRYIEDAHRVSLPLKWESPTLSLCISLVDARGAYVPIKQAGKPVTTCLPVLNTPLR